MKNYLFICMQVTFIHDRMLPLQSIIFSSLQIEEYIKYKKLCKKEIKIHSKKLHEREKYNKVKDYDE